MLSVISWMKLVESAGIICTAIGAGYGVLKIIIRPTKKFFKATSDFYNNCNYLVKEVKPNGGTSLKDSVEGLKHSIDSIVSTVIRLDQRQVAIANHHEKGIFETDINGDVIFVNRALCQMYQRTPEEIMGKGWKACIHSEIREHVVEEWVSCVKEQRDFIMTIKMIHPDFSEFTIDAHAYVLKDLKGKAIGFMGFVSEVH